MRRPRAGASRGGSLAKLAAIFLPSTVVFVTTVAPRMRTCGTRSDELSRDWPGDQLVSNPSFVWTNALTIDCPAEEVWPWVTQLGQGRGGLYSYDWLENAVLANVDSVDEIRRDLQEPLQVGERVIRMTRYAPYNPVALYEPGHALVLGGVADSDDRLRAGHPTSTWAFIVEPIDDRQCRLVVRTRASSLAARLQGPFQFVMQHRMMRGIKQRAERTWTRSTADVLVPVSWFAATVVGAIHTARALRTNGHAATRELALASLAGLGVELLLFWDLPTPVRNLILIGLAGSTALPTGRTR